MTDNRVRAFLEGLAAPWQGFRYMRQHPRLWRYGIVPVVLNLLITLVIFIASIVGVVLLWNALRPWLAERGHGTLGEVLAFLVLIAAALGLAIAAWKLLEGILCGHYYGLLAHEVERQLGLPSEELRDIPFRYQVVDSVRETATLVAVNAALLLAHCVPVVGSLAGLLGAVYFNGYILGRSQFDYPLALRGRRRAEKQEFLRQHRATTLGLGAAVFAFRFIPILGAVVLTTAITGTVLLHRRLQPQPIPTLSSPTV